MASNKSDNGDLLHISGDFADLSAKADPQYFMLLIIQILHIQVHAYDDNDTLIESITSSDKEADPLQNDSDFLKHLLNKARSEKVFLESDHGSVVYGGLCAGNNVFIFGPVVIGIPDKDTAKVHGLRHNCKEVYLTKGDVPSFASALLLMHSICSGEALSLNAFIARSFLNSSILNSIDQKISHITALNIDGQPHHPLSMETRVLEQIRLGEPENLMKSLDYPYPGRRGTLARDTLRSEKNIGIIDVTLSARSAISGGLEVETAYVIADAFILEIEDATSPQEVFAIKTAAQLHFARKVKETQGKKKDFLRLNQPPMAQEEHLVEHLHPHDKLIMTVKNYIKRFINQKLTLEEICANVDVSKSYLQHVFKSREGISLMRYCRREKIVVAAHLLRNSDYSIAEISDMLSFCSKSHFTRCFKQEKKLTPDAYRLKHKVTI